jgi:glycosyltransferase involved in cell wall biosynthesis
LLADDAAGFAHQVLKLLANPALRQTIGTHGKNYVKQHHNWSQIGTQLEAIYESAMTNVVNYRENSEVIT